MENKPTREDLRMQKELLELQREMGLSISKEKCLKLVRQSSTDCVTELVGVYSQDLVYDILEMFVKCFEKRLHK